MDRFATTAVTCLLDHPFLCVVTGVGLIVTSIFTMDWLLVAGVCLLMPGLLSSAPDARYFAPTWRAWRRRSLT
jgi:hypothetical protein